jgi:hypothetical protein
VSVLASGTPTCVWPTCCSTGQCPLPLPPGTITVEYPDCHYSCHSTWLPCRGCTLDPDSLDCLAQLASLRELQFDNCAGVTQAALEGRFSAHDITGVLADGRGNFWAQFTAK